MPATLKKRVLTTFKAAIALTPWLVAMYVFYWLDSSGTWTSETPHRGKMSVVLLAAGMLSSFLLHSRLVGRKSI